MEQGQTGSSQNVASGYSIPFTLRVDNVTEQQAQQILSRGKELHAQNQQNTTATQTQQGSPGNYWTNDAQQDLPHALGAILQDLSLNGFSRYGITAQVEQTTGTEVADRQRLAASTSTAQR